MDLEAGGKERMMAEAVAHAQLIVQSIQGRVPAAGKLPARVYRTNAEFAVIEAAADAAGRLQRCGGPSDLLQILQGYLELRVVAAAPSFVSVIGSAAVAARAVESAGGLLGLVDTRVDNPALATVLLEAPAVAEGVRSGAGPDQIAPLLEDLHRKAVEAVLADVSAPTPTKRPAGDIQACIKRLWLPRHAILSRLSHGKTVRGAVVRAQGERKYITVVVEGAAKGEKGRPVLEVSAADLKPQKIAVSIVSNSQPAADEFPAALLQHPLVAVASASPRKRRRDDASDDGSHGDDWQPANFVPTVRQPEQAPQTGFRRLISPRKPEPSPTTPPAVWTPEVVPRTTATAIPAPAAPLPFQIVGGRSTASAYPGPGKRRREQTPESP
eukprot:TRINITY_DN2521_c2_g1_i2.p1 TRINITY_DN2521_c2_g1~~TRINITY_DN2521_c2_g1_i2.p1  ORF type:complete len:383 (+),score=141.95 TRINITY_DN2521_c2_g1_i2:248-1396(+)